MIIATIKTAASFKDTSAKESVILLKKVSFGKKVTGKARKSYGPKDQKPKRYRGQGR